MLATSMLTVPGLVMGSPVIGYVGLVGLGVRVVLSVLVIVLAGVGLTATRPQGSAKLGRAAAGAAAALGYLHLLLAITTAARAAIYYLQYGGGDRIGPAHPALQLVLTASPGADWEGSARADGVQ